MKCDELKDYDIMDIEAMDDERLEKSESCKIQVTRVCIKSEVDAAIAELKAKINRKEAVGKRWFERCMEERAENVRLKHALWLLKARYFWILMVYASDLSKVANPSIIHKSNFFENPTGRCMEEYQHEAELYDNARIKCIKKAEEYK